MTTLYAHFTTPSISAGLSATSIDNFTLNNLPLTIYSGAIHYFRVPREYWRDRLRKLKAAGLNTVETYVPWNLHEETPGNYDFGAGGTDFEKFLDIADFLKLAQEEELFAIVRPGPYICSEWDFGGLPSWLLKDPEVKIRRNDPKFLGYVERYFKVLFEILTVLQFTNGGPIIAFQVENEYGNVKVKNEPIDSEYLNKLVKMFTTNGVVELLFTSDTPSNGDWGAIKGLLNTANFQTDANKELAILKKCQPDKALMVMEFWTGWFDHWGEKHHQVPTEQFARELEAILKFPSSVNFYMFHGGTNWGFLNGANIKDDEDGDSDGNVVFDTSSYDYDAPLTENGDYGAKYRVIQSLIEKYNKIKVALPKTPREIPRVKFPDLQVQAMMKMSTFLDLIVSEPVESLKTMEFFDQNYGYIVYSKTVDLKPGSVLKIPEKVKDTLLVLVNGQLVNKPFEKRDDLNGFGYWKATNSSIVLTRSQSSTNETLYKAQLDLIVENFGRVNYGKLHQFNQHRGFSTSSQVFINDEDISNSNTNSWTVRKLPFSKKLISFITNNDNQRNWETFDANYFGPALYKFELFLNEDELAREHDKASTTEPEGKYVDTFINMAGWNKGIVIVNGFVLSRYFKIGPQQTCYLPGPFLKAGSNEIIVFEHFLPNDKLVFSDEAIFLTLTL